MNPGVYVVGIVTHSWRDTPNDDTRWPFISGQHGVWPCESWRTAEFFSRSYR